MNSSKLKAAIVERELTQKQLSNILKMDKSTFSRKINGKSSFSVEEAGKIVNILKLDSEQVTNIFFS